MKKNKKNRFLLIILLLPLFFINVKDSHDWGDDFAQYLIQSKNIIEFLPQNENGIIKQKDAPVYAVEAYPIGFPLLIAPVYFYYDLAIKPYLILIALFLVACGLLCYDYFRKRTGELGALIITLLFCYNPQVIELKKWILSDIPFTCSVLLFLFWVESDDYKKKYSWLITSAMLAFIVSLRLTGLAFVGGYFIFGIYQALKRTKSEYSTILRASLSFILSSTIFILLNQYIFKVDLWNLGDFYINAFDNYRLRISENIGHYYSVTGQLFPFFGLSAFSFWIVPSLFGWIIHLFKKPTLAEFIFPVYVLCILLYPYSDGGARFVIPIFPFLIYYFGYGISTILNYKNNKFSPVALAIYISLLVAYIPNLTQAIKTQNNIEDGPEKETSVELFNFIQSLPNNSVIAFCRARAMHLYTGYKSVYFNHYESPTDIYEHFKIIDNLIVVEPKNAAGNTIFDAKLSEIILGNKENYEVIWENKNFIVYNQKQESFKTAN